MTKEELKKIVEGLVQNATQGRDDAAWATTESLLREQYLQKSVALALIAIVEGGHLPAEKALLVLAQLYRGHLEDPS
jgi:hypothetical protein